LLILSVSRHGWLWLSGILVGFMVAFFLRNFDVVGVFVFVQLADLRRNAEKWAKCAVRSYERQE